MVQEVYLGRRLSYSGSLCTVRYVGAVQGTGGSWLGVEWDDPSRGKHDGTYGGVKYFECVSKESTAASFVRPSKPFVPSIGFLTAMRQKYGSGDGDDLDNQALRIGGKEVDEVGFNLINQMQSAWSDLKYISLNSLCIHGISAAPGPREARRIAVAQSESMILQCKELDLSRNLIENWSDVVDICSALSELRVLKLNGNRFKDLLVDAAEEQEESFVKLSELSLANTAVSWDEALVLCTREQFSMLQTLSLAFNPLDTPSTPSSTLSISSLTRLDLTSSGITNLQDITFLSKTPNLATLILRSNPLTTLSTNSQLIFAKICTLDLTSTLLPNLSSLSPIPTIFPVLEFLQTLHTPLSASHPESRLLTIARLPGLTTLNNTTIPDRERLNAELYYQNLIANLLLAASTRDQETQIHIDHPQWQHLCSKHGEPERIQEAKRQSSTNQTDPQPPANQEQAYPRMSLAAHLCTFTFYIPSPPPAPALSTSSSNLSETEPQPQSHTLPLPTLISVYALKGILGRLLALPPLSLRLVLESNELDPVPAPKPADNDWSCSEDESSDDERSEREKKRGREEREGRKEKLWMRREMEIVDSVRKVGDWVGKEREVRVRVEVRGLGERREWER